ncbi:tRNA(Ser) Um(44) 2'-O-methyltransferase [Toensbergia leucococca]|nr:tRNA(Ser) Um(44) 2'-O-methyltransferase [Toensbergia leucococca]
MFEPVNLTLVGSETTPSCHRLPDELWIPILEHACDFPTPVFEHVALNLIRNPNVNSTHLFRADILYDSLSSALENEQGPEEGEEQAYGIRHEEIVGFEVKRTIVRRMVPRNPQLDKPIAQTCHIFRSVAGEEDEKTLVVYIPHVENLDEIPWYHPAVQSIAYLHTSHSLPNVSPVPIRYANISLHYRLFPSQSLPFSHRLLRTGHQLLSTLYKHGQGNLAGYTKRVHHDQLISQQRVQDTYTALKQRHARRLCDNWVEQTESSKHVFEDLGIAAFLIELWRDMYTVTANALPDDDEKHSKTAFPGFVDIGCGNGVLVDILLQEGYQGWGFDARHRKSWSTFPPSTQKHLKELVLIPQPLFELDSPTNRANGGILCPSPSLPAWHNGIFPQKTFVISNHADELTPWTPLLASLSSSPFLAIPCCSHNLSGNRFRAPTAYNSHTASALAPSYFAAHISTAKSIAITIPATTAELEEDDDDAAALQQPQPAKGDLKDLSVRARAKQPSAYSSLCDWVACLAGEVGYVIEREMLRTPSTRNVGLVGRAFESESKDVRRERVMAVVRREKADAGVWVGRIGGLVGGKKEVDH